jgi:hypothetical protein
MICPRCGFEGTPSQETVDTATDGKFVTIARFAWASEAGYFSHELSLPGDFETRIVWEDQSDTIHGFWQGEYLLQVPPDWTDEARARLRGLLDDKGEVTEPTRNRWSGGADADDATFDPQTSSGINWVPIILTLTAGSMAAISYQVWSRNGERPPVARDESLDVEAHPAPGNRVFMHESDDGSQWAVRFDSKSDQMILTEDVDGDRRPERRHVLHAVP